MMMGLGLLAITCSVAVAAQSPELGDLLERYDVEPAIVPEGQPWSSALHRQSVMAQANGREAELAGNLQLAFEAYREAVDADRCNEAAWLGLTRIGRKAGDPSLVREAWGQRLALCPRDPAAIGFAAARAMQLGRDDQALALLLRRHAADRDDTRLESERWNAALGVQLRRVGEEEVAAMLLRDAREALMELAVRSPGDHAHRGQWASLLQQLTSEGSKSLARDVAAARLGSGMLTNRGDRGRFTSTCVALDAVSADAPATAALIRSLPQADLRLRTHFREPLTPAEMWTHASTIHATLGNEDGAIMLLEEAIRFNGDLPLALNNLGYMLLERDVDHPRAAAMIEAAWELDPASPANLDSLGWLRVMEGRLEDDQQGRGALSLLREAARLSDQMDPVILEHLGEAEAAAGREEAARRTWRHALSLLSHPRFVADHVRVYDLVQNGDWGIRLVPSRELYDLEFGDNAMRLRARIGMGEEEAN
jgi:tetratricopeptide (TPR) repeat protein